MKFKAKIIKLSKTSSGVIIPKAYIDNGQLTLGNKYDFEVN